MSKRRPSGIGTTLIAAAVTATALAAMSSPADASIKRPGTKGGGDIPAFDLVG